MILLNPFKEARERAIRRQAEQVRTQAEAVVNAQARAGETATESEPLFNQTTMIGAAVAVAAAYLLTRKKRR